MTLNRVIVPRRESRSYTASFRLLSCITPALPGVCRVMDLPTLLLGEIESFQEIPEWLGRQGVKNLADDLVAGESNSTVRVAAIQMAGRVNFHFDGDLNPQNLWVTMTVYAPGKGKVELYRITIKMDLGGSWLESWSKTSSES